MGAKEKSILNDIQLYFTTISSRIFRNNVAMSWSGSKVIKNQDGSITILNPRPIKSGLAVGSSDLVGWTTITINESHVGQQLAVFTAIEVKTKNLKPTEQQLNFIKIVNESGGIAFAANSLDDVKTKMSIQK